MLMRRGVQALLAVLVTGLITVIAAQPASAATIVPAGQSGNTCGPYKNSAGIRFQACAWVSYNPSGGSRIWFSGHFANPTSAEVRAVNVTVGFYQDGEQNGVQCGEPFTVRILPGRTAATNPESPRCWFPRYRTAVQAWVKWGPEAQSPTLHIRG